MQSSTKALVLAALAVPATAVETNPVAKVLDLISGLQSKIISEGEAAQKAYDEFAEWCEDTSKNIGYEISTGKKTVDNLKATIAEETASIDALDTKLQELSSDIATDEADLKAASEVRAKEHTDFSVEDKDLVEVVDTLQRAIGILENEMQKGGASMLQLKNADNLAQAFSAMVQASMISTADASKLTALVQSSQESDESEGDDALGAPAAAVYQGHSSNIIDTLGDLLEKAQAQLADARSTESIALHNFEMLKQSLDDQIKFASRDTADAKKAHSESSEKKSVAIGDLEVTSKDLAGDQQTKAGLHQNCLTKASDFEASTKSRAEELSALAKAKEVISATTSGATSQSYSFIQTARLASATDLAKFEAVRFVRDLAIKSNNPALAQLASRMASAMRLSSSSGDPFAKVKGLLEDMLDRLQSEAAADATQEAYCDKEMAESHEKEEDMKSDIAKLSTKLDQMSSRSAKLKEEVANLQKNLALLASTQAEMGQIRAEQNAVYKTNRPEMEQGLEGIKTALQVLRDYYAQDSAHSAAEGAGGGIVGLLEVCESDFSKGLAEMIATEEQDAATYKQETKENAVEKTLKTKDVEYKTKEYIGLDKAIGEASSDRAGVQAELDAVLEYLKKLDDMCIAKPDTYAVRKSRRESELAGLKEALKILEGEAVLLQQTRRTLLVQRH
jgi:hypothetical protein